MQREDHARRDPRPAVSILYEANEVCNLLIWGVLQAGSEVSILEAGSEGVLKQVEAAVDRGA